MILPRHTCGGPFSRLLKLQNLKVGKGQGLGQFLGSHAINWVLTVTTHVVHVIKFGIRHSRTKEKKKLCCHSSHTGALPEKAKYDDFPYSATVTARNQTQSVRAPQVTAPLGIPCHLYLLSVHVVLIVWPVSCALSGAWLRRSGGFSPDAATHHPDYVPEMVPDLVLELET